MSANLFAAHTDSAAVGDGENPSVLSHRTGFPMHPFFKREGLRFVNSHDSSGRMRLGAFVIRCSPGCPHSNE